MTILAECPLCHKKQSARNKKCKCGVELDEYKKKQKVRYWIAYRMPDGKQRRESVGAFEGLNPYSITDAKNAEAKRKVQKREKRIFDMLPESNLTFQEVANWYLELASVRKLASFDRITIALNNFNSVLGNQLTCDTRPLDLEDYQEKRLDDGLKTSTLDVELAIVKGMITKAFDNDMLSGRVLKTFRKIKNKTKRGANARKRTVTIAEYLKLLEAASKHLKPILIVAMNTGMRPGELRKLKWQYIDFKNSFIRLPAEITKEGKEKNIPINHHVRKVFNDLKPSLSLVTEDHHDFVFTFGGKPISAPGGVKGAMRNACKSADLPYGRKKTDGIIQHDFRRTVKTNMAAAGISKVCRDVIFGHSLQGMDIHYIVPSEETLKQAMDKYTAWLDKQIDDHLQNVDHSVDQARVYYE